MYSEVQSNHEHRQMFTAMFEALNEQQGAWEKLSSLLDLRLEGIRRQYAYKFCVWISGEDILQEVKLKIHRKLLQARVIRNSEVRHEIIVRLARSVKRIARHAVIDQIRRLKGDTSPIRDVRLDEKGAETYEVFFAEEAKTYEIVLANELTSNLTAQEREMLFQHVIEEMSLRQIAAESGVDKNKVHRIVKGALAKLVKRTLEE
jgi:RNA polymerase sigma factor (sigma-70 family)